MTVLLLLMASYGMTFALMNEKVPIFTGFLTRLPWVGGFFEAMFECSFCTGFHTGWLSWLLWRVGGEGDLGTGSGPVGCILFAFISSAFCYSYDVLLRRLEG